MLLPHEIWMNTKMQMHPCTREHWSVEAPFCSRKGRATATAAPASDGLLCCTSMMRRLRDLRDLARPSAAALTLSLMSSITRNVISQMLLNCDFTSPHLLPCEHHHEASTPWPSCFRGQSEHRKPFWAGCIDQSAERAREGKRRKERARGLWCLTTSQYSRPHICRYAQPQLMSYPGLSGDYVALWASQLPLRNGEICCVRQSITLTNVKWVMHVAKGLGLGDRRLRGSNGDGSISGGWIRRYCALSCSTKLPSSCAWASLGTIGCGHGLVDRHQDLSLAYGNSQQCL